MELRREMFEAAIRLAILVSAVSVIAALGLQWLGDVSTVKLVMTVAIVGFVSSWKMTGRFVPHVADVSPPR